VTRPSRNPWDPKRNLKTRPLRRSPVDALEPTRNERRPTENERTQSNRGSLSMEDVVGVACGDDRRSDLLEDRARNGRCLPQTRTENLTINEPSNLFGEFLSEPMRPEDLPFRVRDLRGDDAFFVPYVNVGIWKSWEDFQSQVGRYFKDDGSHEVFEAAPRERIILSPVEQRRGDWLI
jgi:hypothetical protein